LVATAVSDEEVLKYFQAIPEVTEKPETDKTEPEATKPGVLVEPPEADHDPQEPGMDAVDDQLEERATDLAALIFNVFKKLVLMLAKLFSKGE
jgi:hypothetical protein